MKQAKQLTFSRNQILVSIAILFVAIVILRIHGYSMNSWRGFYGTQFDTGIEFGTPQNIRSDDWGVGLVYNAAQVFAKTPYAQANNNVFNGHKMDFIPGTALPTKSWIMAFRPQGWGYFLGIDYGMAWQWAFLTLFLWGVLFVLFEFYFKLEIWTSLLLASAFAWSPHLALWGYCPSLSISLPLLAYLSLTKALATIDSRAKYLWLALSIWSTFSFIITLYPPFQVMSVLVITMTFLLFDLKKEFLNRHNIIALSVFVVAIVGLLAIFLFENRELLHVIQNTVYPGKRSSAGGDLPWWQPFLATFVSLQPIKDFRDFQANICEASGFLNFIPLVIFIFIFNFKNFDKLTKLKFYGFLSLSFVIYFWQVIGLPEFLSKVFLFSMSTPNRAVISVGLIQMVLFPFLFKSIEMNSADMPKAKKNTPQSQLNTKLLNTKLPFIAWVIFALGCLTYLQASGYLADEVIVGSYFLTVLTIAMAYFCLNLNFKWFAGLFLLHSLFQSFWFNPVVVLSNFENFILNEENVSKIRKVDQQMTAAGKELILVADKNPLLCNLPRMLGIRAYCGNMPIPQFEFWHKLDPEERMISQWNRYAQVNFIVNESVPNFLIQSPQNDIVNIHYNPQSSVLTQLGVNGIILEAALANKFSDFKIAESLYGNSYVLLIRK